MKRTTPCCPLYLRILIFAQFLCWSDGLLRAQNFVPPASAQKYSFYPQSGNFFADLWPNNFVDVDTSAGAGILAHNGSDCASNGHLGIDTGIKGSVAQAVGVLIFTALDGTVIEAHGGDPDNTNGKNAPSDYVKLDRGNGQTSVRSVNSST
jgi:hypothetical protein